jgi:hypothetical protein
MFSDILRNISAEAVLTAFTGVVIWGIRLEGKLANAERDIARHELRDTKIETKLDNYDSKVVREIGDLKETLALIAGKLGIDIRR